MDQAGAGVKASLFFFAIISAAMLLCGTGLCTGQGIVLAGIGTSQSSGQTANATSAQGIIHEKMQRSKKLADRYVIPQGPANIIAVITNMGMVGPKALDVAALAKFRYPAARVKPSRGNTIATIDDLLVVIIKDAKTATAKRGIMVGMSGRDASDPL
jgi:uncharacterized protein YunC (DUF1805 family)